MIDTFILHKIHVRKAFVKQNSPCSVNAGGVALWLSLSFEVNLSEASPHTYAKEKKEVACYVSEETTEK